MGKHASKETVDSIIWDSRSMTTKQLQEKYEIPKSTLLGILYRNGLRAAKRDLSKTIIPKEHLLEAMKDGWISMEEMEKRLDKSYPTIIRSMKAHGIVRGRKPTVRHRIKNSSRAFKVLGYLMANPEESYDFIAKQFLCTREFVSHVAAMARQEGIIK